MGIYKQKPVASRPKAAGAVAPGFTPALGKAVGFRLFMYAQAKTIRIVCDRCLMGIAVVPEGFSQGQDLVNTITSHRCQKLILTGVQKRLIPE